MSGSVQTALYRLLGDDDALLYIGIAKTFGHRWHEHARRQPWWPEVKRQTIDWYPSRPEALTAETAAIEAEHPRYNVAHNRPRRVRAVTAPPPARPAVPLLPTGRPPGAPRLSDGALANCLGIPLAELRRLPVVVTLKEAAPLLGIEYGEARKMVADGRFPGRAITAGKRTVVPVFALLKAPGVAVNVDKLRSLVMTEAAA